MTIDIPENGAALAFKKSTSDWEVFQAWADKPSVLVEALTEMVKNLCSEGCPVFMIHELSESEVPGRKAELIARTRWIERFFSQVRLTRITSEFPYMQKIMDYGEWGNLQIIVGLDLTPQSVRTHPIENVRWDKYREDDIEINELGVSISRVGQDFLLMCDSCDGECLDVLATKGYFNSLSRLYGLLGIEDK